MPDSCCVLEQADTLSDKEWEDLADANFSQPATLHGLPLAERWVLSALHQVMLCLRPWCLWFGKAIL